MHMSDQCLRNFAA